ncbi:MAG TPA: DUF1573 domain-containing protein [Deltaproteobacteria bacterium]|nr:DUF1573 domain-containing protein [Deltaproteobacteria bacterium]HQI80875.1 DUF1573 domain-containing protein [Deltaproteobacteria bacterium]
MVIMCLVIVLMGVHPCHAAPKVQVDQVVHDAGKVPEGTEVAHEFRFRNTGDQVLVIKPRAC